MAAGQAARLAAAALEERDRLAAEAAGQAARLAAAALEERDRLAAEAAEADRVEGVRQVPPTPKP
jgi:hypothetical protein